MEKPVLHQVVPPTNSRHIKWSLSRRQQQWIAGVASGVLIIALGYFIWYKPHTPSAVLARSLQQTLQLQSAAVAVSITNNGAPQLRAQGGVSSTSGYQLAGNYTAHQATLGFDVRSTDSKDVYVKATGLSQLGTLLGSDAGQYGVSGSNNAFASLDNAWLVVPKDTQDELLKNAGTTLGGTQISAADQRKVSRLYEQHPFITVTKTFANETVDGVASHHFQATIDRARLIAFAEAAQKQVTALKITPQQVQSVRTMQLPGYPVDVWVAQGSGYITQVRYSFGKDRKQVLQVNLSKFNQPVKVEKPQQAQPLFQALSGAILSGASLPAAPISQ